MNLRERAVRRCANDVLVEVELASAPVDPVEIARVKGIRLDMAAGFPPDVYGALYQDATGFGIVVSSGCHGDGHRAFTVGHELGHYHIEGHVETLFPTGAGQVLSMGGHFRDRKRWEEREADWFASELLMPEQWAAPRARSLAPTLPTIRALADEFGVSLCCAAIRYAELTEEAAAVVVSKGPQVEWAVLSHRLKEHDWASRALRRDWVPRGTATRRLGDAGARVRNGDEDGSSCFLCEWFDGAPEFVMVDEEALGLGAYGRVLTVLSADNLPTVEELAEEQHGRAWRERDWRDPLRGFSLD